MIIGLGGRKHSGKTEVAKICKEKEFVILHFADSLKNLVCNVLEYNRAELDENKEKSIKFRFNDKKIRHISKVTNIDFIITKNCLKDVDFNSPRHLLQYLGTELIRANNPEWHINEMRKKIKIGENYCIDDCRFPNELNFIKNELKGICFFILRPGNFNISNHLSEVSLKWNNFDDTFVNDIKITTLKNKWSNFIDVLLSPEFKIPLHGFQNKIEFREWLIKELSNNSTTDIAKTLQCSRDKIVWWSNQLMIRISRNSYFYDRNSFLTPTVLHSYCAGLLMADGCIKTMQNRNLTVVSFSNLDLELTKKIQESYGTNRPISITKHKINNKSIYTIDCPDKFIVENLKHWNLKPRKSENEEIPDILKNKEETYIKNWIIGLIDGDGCIKIVNKNLTIQILSSKFVVDYLENFIPIQGIKRQHKDTKLHELNWHNFKALELKKWLDSSIGLQRKWSKLEVFKAFGTKKKHLDKNIVEYIRDEYNKGKKTQASLARELKLTPLRVSNIVNFKTYL